MIFLLTIPFSALMDGTQYLLERMAVVSEPGLNFAIESGPGKALPAAPILPLLAGNSEAITYTDDPLPPLPQVDDELRNLQHLIPNATEPLLNANFTVDSMVHALKYKPFTMVHIEAHATFKPDSGQGLIFTHQKALSLDQIEGALKYNEFRQRPLDLLVLSACSTAAGDDRAALGLAGVAVKAGARTAIGTLWTLNNLVSRQLMPRFYRNLLEQHMTKAEALREAQLYTLRRPQSDEEQSFSNPVNWAPLILVGSWRTISG
jgi:CHAT domain-containing protein